MKGIPSAPMPSSAIICAGHGRIQLLFDGTAVIPRLAENSSTLRTRVLYYWTRRCVVRLHERHPTGALYLSQAVIIRYLDNITNRYGQQLSLRQLLEISKGNKICNFRFEVPRDLTIGRPQWSWKRWKRWDGYTAAKAK